MLGHLEWYLFVQVLGDDGRVKTGYAFRAAIRAVIRVFALFFL